MAITERTLELDLKHGVIEIERSKTHPVSINFVEKPTELNGHEVGNEATMFFETWGDFMDFIDACKYIQESRA